MSSDRKRRSDDKGWRTILTITPIVITLIGSIIIGTIAFTKNTIHIEANAEEVDALKKIVKEHSPRIRILEQNQSVLQSQLKDIKKQQDRSYEKQKDILRAIIGLKNSRR